MNNIELKGKTKGLNILFAEIKEMKIIVKKGEKVRVLERDEKYKKQILSFLDVIKEDDAFTFDDVIDKFLEVIKAKMKSEEDEKKLVKKIAEMLLKS